MNILITGGAGLIGSHLAELLASKHHITIVDNLSYGNMLNLQSLSNANLDFKRENVQDFKFDKRYDVVYHLASLKKPHGGVIKSSYVLDENFAMTRNIVEQCQLNGSYLVFASTSDVYGDSKTYIETEPLVIGPTTNERYSYAMSKLHSEQYILNEISQTELRGTIIRVFGCASARSNRSWSGGHIPLFVDKALRNEDIIIHGDGSQERSIAHAYDIALGFHSIIHNKELRETTNGTGPVALTDKGPMAFDFVEVDKFHECNGQIINIGTQEKTSVIDVARYIKKETKSKSNLIIQTRESAYGDYREVMSRCPNIDKAKDILNFNIRFDTYTVIDEIIEEFKS